MTRRFPHLALSLLLLAVTSNASAAKAAAEETISHAAEAAA